ncbi:ABC-type multidrug transport system fused ATPase/permease subunit [Thermocatellispora tengchongensis]|uniref:ABC-type multidrug transport system fused ATPase/permease subunit n=1 Tax=Thermocatellispora tengchongensis TaxID=1073253 RepID=A0A840NZ84_9ACTN|nr:ABC transporter ATP-binding protein [Thermocatellispora tengchongensis]MBB5134224.1 ABC-type multidrug transport system fused ATPase/permease subunit [Thermocatellispora tengchongensis]
MGFLMDGLDAEDYDRTYNDRDLLRRILSYFRPKLGAMFLVAGMIVLLSAGQAAVPALVSLAVDAIADGTIGEVGWPLVGGILVTGVLSWAFNYIRQKYSAQVTGDVVLRLREDAFDAVLKRDLSFYDETPSGRIVSRVTSDTDDFATVSTLTMDLISQVLMVGFVTVLLFVRSVELALLTLLVVPVVVGLALAFRRMARVSTRRAQRSLSRVNANLQETMGGIAVAKNFRQERQVYDEFRPINRQSYQVTLRQGFVFSTIFPVLFLVAGLATVALVHLGGSAVIGGDLSAGDWYLFLQGVSLFWFPLTSIAAFWSQFQQGLSASERVFALIDAPPRVVQTDARPAGRVAGRIEFQKVTFGYDPAHPVLRDFDLVIEAGETVALVGHTGAGKSTLSKLITRFYEFQQGRLLIDGRDIRTLELGGYRRQIGAVPQAPFLFSGTVADNIRYPRPEASDDDVRAAAAAVGGGDWIEALPSGLETDVGEHGRALSMGQRQLVALARLLIQDPAIVVLDEATASVDPLTEAQIQEGLDVVLAGRTSIVIAHRLSTIEHVDRIIVLDHGRIVEEGDHATLLARGGRYCEVYNTYFRHQSPNYRAGSGFVPVGSS